MNPTNLIFSSTFIKISDFSLINSIFPDFSLNSDFSDQWQPCYLDLRTNYDLLKQYLNSTKSIVYIF